MGEVFVVLGGMNLLQSAASRTVGKREGGTTRGSRPCRVCYRLEMICCRERPMCRSVPGERYFYGAQSYPPSSVANATNCLQFSSPRGEAFLQEFFRTTQQSDDRSKYARPYPSPAATNCSQFSSPSKGKASVGSASFIISASNFMFSKNYLQKNKSK